MTPPDPAVLAAIAAGPVDPARRVPLAGLDRLLDPAPLPVESGWCTLADGVGYVAVRTTMPAVSAEMVEWWFDWHPRDPLRYRIWHPRAHRDNSVEPPAVRRREGPLGRRPPPGRGRRHRHRPRAHRLHRRRPSSASPATRLDDPAVATIVCGYVGDDRRRLRHTVMAHVFLRAGDGVVLRSHFWLGAAIRPYLPAPLAATVGARG